MRLLGLAALLLVSCAGAESFQAVERPQRSESRWPDGYDCGVAVILHLDAVLPGPDGSLDLVKAQANITAAAEVLRAYPQVKITAAFPTSEWETWSMWEASGVEFAEIVGHSHSHHAAILAAMRGPELVGTSDGVYFERFPDAVFDWDYALMNRRLEAIGVEPRGYVAPNLSYSPHMLDVFRRDGLTWYTTFRPEGYGDPVPLGGYRGSWSEFADSCARGGVIVLHLHTYSRLQVSPEVIGSLAAVPGAWFASASEMAALYAPR